MLRPHVTCGVFSIIVTVVPRYRQWKCVANFVYFKFFSVFPECIFRSCRFQSGHVFLPPFCLLSIMSHLAILFIYYCVSSSHLSFCTSPPVVTREHEKRWANTASTSEFIQTACYHPLPIPDWAPPAIFLLHCSLKGLGLDGKCVVFFIHSSQSVMELICLVSIC